MPGWVRSMAEGWGGGRGAVEVLPPLPLLFSRPGWLSSARTGREREGILLQGSSFGLEILAYWEVGGWVAEEEKGANRSAGAGIL